MQSREAGPDIMRHLAPWGDVPVAVMDGGCALCSFAARMIHRIDQSGRLRTCPIQTDPGRAVLAADGLDPSDPESWMLIEEGRPAC